VKRFLVNFQTKNEMMAITATPPATERPIIEPVPRPLELSELDDDVGADDEVELDADCVTSIKLVTVSPAEFVVTCAEVVTERAEVGWVVTVSWVGVLWEVVDGCVVVV